MKQSQVEDIIMHISLLGVFIAPLWWQKWLLGFYAFGQFILVLREYKKEKDEGTELERCYSEIEDKERIIAEAYDYISSMGSFMATDGADWTDENGEEMVQWVKDRR